MKMKKSLKIGSIISGTNYKCTRKEGFFSSLQFNPKKQSFWDPPSSAAESTPPKPEEKTKKIYKKDDIKISLSRLY